MSLINDALKRAKEAQQQAPPPPPTNLPFRPVEPAQQGARRGLGILLLATLALAALLVLFLIWQLAQTRPAAPSTEVNARTAPARQPASASVETGAAIPVPAAKPDLAPAPLAALATALASDTTPERTNPPLPAVQEGEQTNAAAVLGSQAPNPAPLRLQGIVINPRRPSAVINGKTLFLGDKLGNFRLVALDQYSATLVGAGQTNVLTRDE